MSWGEDVRCLFCDGRLPLYRKLTDGQFCSAAHRKGYVIEQQRLGVERLHQFQTGSFAIPVTPLRDEPQSLDATELLPSEAIHFDAAPSLDAVGVATVESSEIHDELPVTAAPPLFSRSSDNGMPAAG